MNDEWSQVAANGVIHAASQAYAHIEDAGRSQGSPSAVYRPAISMDGEKWCALYGDNLQDGVAGFGDSPAQAMADFDRAWYAKLPVAAPQQPAPVPSAYWLIERGPNQGEPQSWWWSKDLGIPSYGDWTRDVHKATKFGTQTEAQEAAGKHYVRHYDVTSHMNLAAPVSAPVVEVKP